MGCTILAVLLVMFIAAALGLTIYDEYRVTHVYTRIRQNLNNQYVVEYYTSMIGADSTIYYWNGIRKPDAPRNRNGADSTIYYWNGINGENVFASYKDAEAAAVAFRAEELKKYNKDRYKKVWYIK